MSDEDLTPMSELEREFMEEVRSYGSLSPHIVGTSADNSSEPDYVGYDIRPEDIEAVFFDGIGTPRWESIVADNVDKQLEIYNESMQKLMSEYPQINRVTDTDVKVEFSPDQVLQLGAECERVLGSTSNPKAVRALKKFIITCRKAAENNMGLMLSPG